VIVARRRTVFLIATSMAAAFAGPVLAADICRGPAPAEGVAVHGPVLAVPDASSLCVATGVAPSDWVRIPLPHLQATHAALMAAAFGKNATCAIDAHGRGACAIEGQALAETLQSPEIVKASVDWR
jgi:hypothetical protein